MKKFVFAILFALVSEFSFSGEEYIMRWMVDDNEITSADGTTMSIEEAGAAYARIFIIPSDDGQTMHLMQLERQKIWSNERYVYSEGNLAVITSDWFGSRTGDTVYANLTDSGFVFEDRTQYQFYVELGTYNSTDGWETLAASQYVAYEDLASSVQQVETFTRGGREYVTGWRQTAAYSGWNFHSVPEPTPGILVAVGFACILLKRKNLTED